MYHRQTDGQTNRQMDRRRQTYTHTHTRFYTTHIMHNELANIFIPQLHNILPQSQYPATVIIIYTTINRLPTIIPGHLSYPHILALSSASHYLRRAQEDTSKDVLSFSTFSLVRLICGLWMFNE